MSQSSWGGTLETTTWTLGTQTCTKEGTCTCRASLPGSLCAQEAVWDGGAVPSPAPSPLLPSPHRLHSEVREAAEWPVTGALESDSHHREQVS